MSFSSACDGGASAAQVATPRDARALAPSRSYAAPARMFKRGFRNAIPDLPGIVIVYTKSASHVALADDRGSTDEYGGDAVVFTSTRVQLAFAVEAAPVIAAVLLIESSGRLLLSSFG